LMARGTSPPRWPDLHVDDVALLQYTGGTTGAPKGAMITHADLTATLEIFETWFRGQGLSMPEQERVICVLPLFHIYAFVAVVLRSLSVGNELLLRARFDVDAILHDIEVKRASVFPGVPTMWIAILSRPDIE